MTLPIDLASAQRSHSLVRKLVVFVVLGRSKPLEAVTVVIPPTLVDMVTVRLLALPAPAPLATELVDGRG